MDGARRADDHIIFDNRAGSDSDLIAYVRLA
jgi:hypothetical protein